MFPDASYDPETLAVMARAFDEAWESVQNALGVKPLDANVLRTRLATRIMTAANRGERDPLRLKLIALGAIEKPRETKSQPH